MKIKLLILILFFMGIAGCSGQILFTGDGCPQDLDCDAIADLVDNCPEDFNPLQSDTDQNGIGEICEEFLPGGVDCSVASCANSEQCHQISRFCPGAVEEIGIDPVCCDGRCAAFTDSPVGCPAGSCPEFAPNHCELNEDCAETESCMEGCCVDFAGSECSCECPPEAEECFLCEPGEPICEEPPPECFCECPPETPECLLCPPEDPSCLPPILVMSPP